MALKAILTEEEHGAIGDTLKGEYTKDGDGFKLDVEAVNGFALANATVLSASASSANAEKVKVEKKLSGFQKKVGDFDLDLLPQAREALEKMEDWDPEEKLKAHKESFEEQTRNAFQSDFDQRAKALSDEGAKKDAVITSRTQQLKRALFEARALQLCSQFNADPTFVSVVRDQSMVGWEEDSETNRLSLIVLDENGNKKLSVGKDGSMVPTSLEELYKNCQGQPEKYGIFFKPPDKTGSGAGGSSSTMIGGLGENPWAKETWNLTKQGELYRKDPVTAKRLAAAAGITLPEIPE